MNRLAALVLAAAANLFFVEGCMFGCDVNGIDANEVGVKAQKIEGGVTCGVQKTAHLRATDEKGNSLTFVLTLPAHEGDSFALSLDRSGAPVAANEQVVTSADGAATMKLGMAAGADAIDTTEITSAAVVVTSLPAANKPFTIEVRVGFLDGATFTESYTVEAPPDPECQPQR